MINGSGDDGGGLLEEGGRRVDLDGADDRTLRLSVPILSAEKIDRLITFQKKLISELRALGTHDEASVSKAHEAAATHSKMTAREANELEAVARMYAGQAWTLRRLEQRLEEARARLAAAQSKGEQPSPREAMAVEKLPKEIALKKAPKGLQSRYGEEALRLLSARHDELLSLHEELTALLRR